MTFVRWLFIISAILPLESAWAQADESKLLGTWHLHLWVTGSADKSAGPRAANGRLELRRLDLPASPAPKAMYSVTYDTSLHAMFGAPRFGPAQAVLTPTGEVELAFNPFIDHGTFRLTGSIRGDSITGTWHRINFADDGYRGRFTLVRRQNPGAAGPRARQPPR